MKMLLPAILMLCSIHLYASQESNETAMTVIVHTPTNHLEQSLGFYKKLQYKNLTEENANILTDGHAIIEINPDRYARAGLKIYKQSWAKEIVALEKLTTVHKLAEGHLVNDFNGCWIYLMEGEMNPAPDLAGKSTGLTGNFQGMSLESSDMARSVEVWEALGFSIKMGTVENGFLLLDNQEGFTISLMKPQTCPHLFFNPSLTFFNGENNIKVIENIRKAGIQIAEEITHFNKEGIVDNIIIRDPGGLGFFIFSD